MQWLLSLQQRCSFVLLSELWRMAATGALPLRKACLDAVSCVLADAKLRGAAVAGAPKESVC